MDMKIRLGIFGFILGMAFFANFLSPPGLYGEEKVHVVLKGETFYSIARAFGIKADDLMKHNGINDPARLQAGQRLKIPGPAGQAGTAIGAGQQNYRVVRGDTFYSIARKFSVTVGAIRGLNSLPENYVLREGDSLRLPPEASLPPEARIPAGAGLPAEARTGTGVAAGPPRGGSGARETETRNVNSSVIWPINARELCYMTGKLSGVAITGLRAEPVKSLTWGTVLSAGPYRGFGKVVIVQVEGGYLYVYGGCEGLSVKEGDKVKPGMELGKLGIDTVTNKPQLFFMVYKSNTPIDPAKAPRA